MQKKFFIVQYIWLSSDKKYPLDSQSNFSAGIRSFRNLRKGLITSCNHVISPDSPTNSCEEPYILCLTEFPRLLEAVFRTIVNRSRACPPSLWRAGLLTQSFLLPQLYPAILPLPFPGLTHRTFRHRGSLIS